MSSNCSKTFNGGFCASGYARRVSALDVFSPGTRAWFEQAFDGPTPAQELGWPAIARGGHTLIQAPTGSGKTLAAFLYGIDQLNPRAGRGPAPALRLAAEGAELRHRAQPARAAGRPAARSCASASARRHAAEGARRDGAQAARHPDHDPGVALPAADLAGARDAARDRDRDRRRGARRRGHEARRASGVAASSGSTGSRRSRSSGSGCRRRSDRWRRSAASSRAGARSSSSTPAARRSST